MADEEKKRGDDLPEGWTKQFSRSQNRTYYFHKDTNTSVWSLEDVGKVKELKKKRPRVPARSSAATSAEKQGGGKRARVQQEFSKKPGISVAVIVPFRDLHKAQKRAKHLAEFAPHMASTLNSTPGISKFHIFIVEQSDDGRKFNRGKLLNIGFSLAAARGPYDSYIFHDVDLLPYGSVMEWYAMHPRSPVHIARCWDRYNDNEKYFGGIVAFSGKDFKAIDGFPNTFWGWGGEDDELQRRVEAAKLQVISPPKKLTGGGIADLEGMDIKTKMQFLRQTDWKCKVKWEVLEEHEKMRGALPRPKWWGLRDVECKVVAEKTTEGGKCSRITVHVTPNVCADGSSHWANAR